MEKLVEKTRSVEKYIDITVPIYKEKTKSIEKLIKKANSIEKEKTKSVKKKIEKKINKIIV